MCLFLNHISMRELPALNTWSTSFMFVCHNMPQCGNHIIFTVTQFYTDRPDSLTGHAHWTLTVCSQFAHSQEKVLCLCLTFQSLLVTWCTNSLKFNNCTLCPHCIYMFCIYLRTNGDLCHLQHKLIGFYNPDEKCLQRGTDWVFK